MIRAEEAKSRVVLRQQEMTREHLINCNDRVKRAIADGKSTVTLDYEITREAKAKLEELGYNVNRSGRTQISWY